VLFLAILVLLIWIYLIAFHSGFWRIRLFQLPAAGCATKASIAVIIPARDEADVIGRAIGSLLSQDFCGDIRLFLVDDHSSDGTANAARACAGMLGCSEKLTVIQSDPLPLGWTGKVWAMQQGWQAARQMSPDFVLFTDADVEHSLDNASRLLGQAEAGPYDLVSLMVRLRSENLREKFLIPAFVYFFFLLYPPAKISNPRSRVAGAAGGCILARRELLERIGGLESIRGEIIDDCALARTAKSVNGRLWLGVTDETRSLRSYGTLSNIRDMIARTAFNQLRHSTLLLAGSVAGMLLTFIAPLLLVSSNKLAIGWIAMATCMLMFVSYAPTLRLYRINLLAAVTLPFAALFYIYATILSACNYWMGKGGSWKGRDQDQALLKEK
jgi:hopene-associated glycosyltransferase HpnB